MIEQNKNRIIYICFFLSGLAGLIYEVIWAKYFSLLLGNASYAHTLVLATFMGGLASGSYFLGKIADKKKNLLSFYAWIEISIAIYCLFTPLIFTGLQKGSSLLIKNSNFFLTINFPLKFLIGAIIVIIPTFLMGGTLPILSKALIKKIKINEKTIARLYYINSFGAVIGTILAGFILILYLGLAKSIIIAVLFNLISGLLILYFSKYHWKTCNSETVNNSEHIIEENSYNYSNIIIKISIISIFISGIVSMIYELAWIRLLTFILGSSTYSFSLMLAAFITGISFGSWLLTKFMPKIKHAFLVFGLCELGIGLSLILTLAFYDKLPHLFIVLSQLFKRNAETFILYSFIKFFISFLIMILPTLFIGMTVPLVSNIVSNNKNFSSKKIGTVLAFNTSGNIIGATLAGLILMPILGLRHLLELGIFLNLIIGFVIFYFTPSLNKNKKILIICTFVLFCITSLAVLPEWNQRSFMGQIFRGKGIQDYFKEWIKHDTDSIVYHKDGTVASVSVLKSKTYEDIVMFVNGKADASAGENSQDLPTQTLLSQLPLLLKPESKDIMVIGLGSGITCGSALLHPIETLDLIEISPEVIEASKFFKKYNYDALSDERLNVHIEDAKTFLNRTKTEYDIIISEPSNPWMDGIGTLFSKDFFTECKNKLSDDGLMVQWIQDYEMDDITFEMIVRTFMYVFPEVTMWTSGIGDILLLGSKNKLELNYEATKERFKEKKIQKDLKQIELNDLVSFYSLQIASQKRLMKVINPYGPINTDKHPLLAYIAPKGMYIGASPNKTFLKLDERKLPYEKTDLLLSEYLKTNKITKGNLENLFNFFKLKKSWEQYLLNPIAKTWNEIDKKNIKSKEAYIQQKIDVFSEKIKDLENKIILDKEYDLIEKYCFYLSRNFTSLQISYSNKLFYETRKKFNNILNLSKEHNAIIYFSIGDLYKKNLDYDNALNNYLKSEKAFPDSFKLQESKADFKILLEEIRYIYYLKKNKEKIKEYINKINSL